MKTILILCFAFTTLILNAQNPDGTTLNMVGNTMTLIEGPQIYSTSKFVIQLNEASFEQAISLLVDAIPAKQDCSFQMKRIVYDIVYNDGIYSFMGASFKTKAELCTYLKLFIKMELLKN